MISFILFTHLGISQSISGTITDANNIPLPEAYIYCLNSDIHIHSDQLGNFKCSGLQSGDTVRVSFIGFKSIDKIITDEDFIHPLKITLQEANYQLDQVYISNSLQAVNQITTIDLSLNPVKSSQEVLRKVPGLFIGQHAGGGKAEQIFLRGFDIDHGTDIAITVDGLPVNMVSHAHGQGYADLHFLIPETIDKIDFAKGPYYADHGNFNTAGYVDFKTKDRIDQSMLSFELGQFNTLRSYGQVDLLEQSDVHNAYIATEYIETNGPVESPQNFHRFNVMGKYSYNENGNRWSLLASTFTSQWRASGQIPQRLVDDGSITRFGSVDDTEGGQTSRTNIALNHSKELTTHSFVKTRAYYSDYDFELYSNFTFFLEDPLNGDQIRQKENRSIYGVETSIYNSLNLSRHDVELKVGVGLRYDNIDNNELSHTRNRRETLEQITLGDVDETNLYGFADAKINFGHWVLIPGARIDYFNFNYTDFLQGKYFNQEVTKSKISPKLNLLYNPNSQLQLFMKTGIGFHSNDSRVVIAQEGREILPSAYGSDLGFIWKPSRKLWINSALWYLALDQEFVYVGDAGIVEPSGKTKRMGIESGIRYQINEQLYFDQDFNYTYARSTEDPEGQNYIPLAPDLTLAGGISFQSKKLTTSLRYRYIKDRPANEDNSLVAEGYFITDINTNLQINKNWSFGVVIENLFNQEWNEAQFATESRLRNESEAVEEIHFTPGTPFFIKANFKYRF